MPYGDLKNCPVVINALAIIGSNIAEFNCPKCTCHDRERHLFLYLTNIGMLKKFNGAKILHFAPESELQKIIVSQSPKEYIKCDLYPTQPDMLRVDMLDIQFESRTFDYVIANHVLEHVPNDLKAISELHRVLKKGGMAILQTPYSNKLLSTFSDPGIDDDFARLQIYGQEDHMRLYGKDIFSRFQSVGFVSHVANHLDILPDIDPLLYGVNPDEPLFLFERID